jgi:hypothetical protein
VNLLVTCDQPPSNPYTLTYILLYVIDTWKRIAVANSFPARFGHTSIFDSSRAIVYTIFGLCRAEDLDMRSECSDIWTWHLHDGEVSSWNLLYAGEIKSISSRVHHTTVFDSVKSVAYIVGGSDNNMQISSDVLLLSSG